MHIGLNLIFLVPGETGGMEVVARELIPAMIAAAPDARFTAFVNREAAGLKGAPWTELIRSVTVPVHARHRIEWVRGEQMLLPELATQAGVDLLHSLGSTAPGRGAFRRVVTVHDLIYRRFPEAHTGVRSIGMRLLVPWGVRRSHRVIAISQSTRHDLIELMGVAGERIDVIPNGVGGEARTPPSAPDALRARLDLDRRKVLLSLSAHRPHKNLPALLEALSLIPPERRPVLVIPGYRTGYEHKLRDQARALGVERDLRLPGWMPDGELETLWSITDAFVFPSLYEGFGLPVLEAMARGVPVACSHASSLPEVAGEAALFFAPRDTRGVASTIERLLGEPDLAQRLRAAGRERARKFTWRQAAELTLQSYERALSAAAP